MCDTPKFWEFCVDLKSELKNIKFLIIKNFIFLTDANLCKLGDYMVDMTFQYAEPPKEQFCQKSFWYHYFLNFYQNLYPEVPFVYCCPQIRVPNKGRWTHGNVKLLQFCSMGGLPKVTFCCNVLLVRCIAHVVRDLNIPFSSQTLSFHSLEGKESFWLEKGILRSLTTWWQCIWPEGHCSKWRL